MEKRTKEDIKRVVLIGAESTGKTQLAEYLANQFNTVFVPEYARDYIENLNRAYTYNDVEHIANKQLELEEQFSAKANKILFYDTYLIITKVWFRLVYNKIPEWLEVKIRNCHIDLFLLCDNEIEWIPDSVRENGGEMRDRLFNIYQEELVKYGFKYAIVKGNDQDRYDNALNLVNGFLNQNLNCGK